MPPAFDTRGFQCSYTRPEFSKTNRFITKSLKYKKQPYQSLDPVTKDKIISFTVFVLSMIDILGVLFGNALCPLPDSGRD